jgi:hypothetical protein
MVSWEDFGGTIPGRVGPCPAKLTEAACNLRFPWARSLKGSGKTDPALIEDTLYHMSSCSGANHSKQGANAPGYEGRSCELIGEEKRRALAKNKCFVNLLKLSVMSQYHGQRFG